MSFTWVSRIRLVPRTTTALRATRKTIQGSKQVLMTAKKVWALLFALMFLLFLIPSASATERLCDVSFEDCRAPLLQLIKNENQEIDAAFWFMDDVNIESALIAAQNRGVYVRMLVDQRSFEGHPSGTAALKCFAGLGPCPITLTGGHFPMRQRQSHVPRRLIVNLCHDDYSHNPNVRSSNSRASRPGRYNSEARNTRRA